MYIGITYELDGGPPDGQQKMASQLAESGWTPGSWVQSPTNELKEGWVKDFPGDQRSRQDSQAVRNEVEACAIAAGVSLGEMSEYRLAPRG